MLSEEHELFVGTKNGDVVASAIVTATDDSLLISDVVNQHDQDCIGFAKQLLEFWAQDQGSSHKVWLES